MKLTGRQRETLTILASRPPERPWVLYRMKAGPSLMRPDFTWVNVSQVQVDRLVAAGLLVEQGPYWTITEAGRAAVVSADTGQPEPAPATTRRRGGQRRTA